MFLALVGLATASSSELLDYYNLCFSRRELIAWLLVLGSFALWHARVQEPEILPYRSVQVRDDVTGTWDTGIVYGTVLATSSLLYNTSSTVVLRSTTGESI